MARNEVATTVVVEPLMLGQPVAAARPVRRRTRASQALRKFHLWLGITFTINFLLLLLTGVMVQHRGLLGLEARTVSRRWLPAGYRPQDPDSEIRPDIVLTDLHSGRLFGPRGPLVVDGAAVAWILMMCSGYAVQLASRYRNGNSRQ